MKRRRRMNKIKLPRKLKKKCTTDRWNWGLTKYVKHNKRMPLRISKT